MDHVQHDSHLLSFSDNESIEFTQQQITKKKKNSTIKEHAVVKISSWPVRKKFGAKRRLQNGITEGTAWFKTMSIKETKYYCLEYINESSRSVSN